MGVSDPRPRPLTSRLLPFGLGGGAALLTAAEQPLPNGERVAPGNKGGPPLQVDPVQAFPKFRRGYTVWKRFARYGPMLTLKFPDFIDYLDPRTRPQSKASLASEVHVMEQLRKYHMENGPDPRADHIINYHGVLESNGRIPGLVFDCLPNVLQLRCTESPLRPLDVDKVINGVRAALSYLHEYGLCHNDVGPQNIGLTADEEAVLVNFESCLPPGEPLTKGGATKRLNPDATTSCEQNDLLCVEALEAELRDMFGW